MGGAEGVKGQFPYAIKKEKRSQMATNTGQNTTSTGANSPGSTGLGAPIPLLPGKPVDVRTAQQARRLMGKLIREFQKGVISGKDAKNLSYLVVVYLTACRQDEIEQRVKLLEKKLEASHGHL